MIPKRIHYCWFGGNPLPKLAKKCIKSWKKYCPDYEIVCWDESNYDISAAPLYVRQAYEAKKWAFVTDYVRLQVVYDHGGIYLDTDVELIKSFDSLLEYNAFFGFEDDQYIATGLGFGSEKGGNILYTLMEDYRDTPFCLSDNVFDLTPCPKRNLGAFCRNGFVPDNTFQVVNNCAVLPKDYLCPVECESGRKKITDNTIAIHWFAASWLPESLLKKRIVNKRKIQRADFLHDIFHIPNRMALAILGEQEYRKLKQKVKSE